MVVSGDTEAGPEDISEFSQVDSLFEQEPSWMDDVGFVSRVCISD